MLVGWCSLTSSTLLAPLPTTSFRLFVVGFRRVRGGLGMEFVCAWMMVWGDLVPIEGEVRGSQKLRIDTYAQHFVDLLTMVETLVQCLLRLHPDQEELSKQEAVRTKLGKFGLPSHNHLTLIAKLSGGKKARVVFTSISMSKPHILLLDEPTNHLDMQSIDALADALEEFTGGVVLVNHDSRLMSRICEDEERSEIWVVENEMRVLTLEYLRSTRRSFTERSRSTIDLAAVA